MTKKKTTAFIAMLVALVFIEGGSAQQLRDAAFSVPGEEIPLSPTLEGPWAGIHYDTAVASDGRDFLVAFAYASKVWFQRVDANGAILDARPRHVGRFTGNISAEWDGQRYVIASSGQRSRIDFIDARGEVVNPPLEIDGYVHELVGFDDGVAVVVLEGGGITLTFLPNDSAPVFIGKLAKDRFFYLSVARLRGDWFFVWYAFLGSNGYQLQVSSAATGETTAGVVTTEAPLFSPSRGTGGLAVVIETGRLYGRLLQDDRTFSQSFPLGDIPVVRSRIQWLVRDQGGWRVRYGERIARIHSAGRVEDVTVRNASPGDGSGISYSRAGTEASILQAKGGYGPGVSTFLIRRDEYFTGPTLAIGDAAQYGAAIASTDGVSLVVWAELNSGGRTLRATRVDSANRPLDGTGILISETVGGAFDVEWDGENFVVAWTSFQNGASLAFVRLIGTDGTFRSEPMRLDGDFFGSLDIATRGEGKSIVVGLGTDPSRRWLQTILSVPLNHGVPGRTKVVGDERYPASYVFVEGGRDGYLMAWSDAFGCQITCPPPSHRPFLRRLTSDGDAVGGTRILSEVAGTSALAVMPNDLGSWTVATAGPRGGKLLRLNPELQVVSSARTPPTWNFPQKESDSIVFSSEAGLIRYSDDLRLLDFRGEFRPGRTLREDGATRVSVVTRIVNEVLRLFLRVDGGNGSGADIEVRRHPSSRSNSDFRLVVTHRGGDIVDTLYVLVSGMPRASVNTPGGSRHTQQLIVMDGVFRPGDSHEIMVRLGEGDIEGSLWVFPNTNDPQAANNVVEIARASRRRGGRN